jgi:hypothetical protein
MDDGPNVLEVDWDQVLALLQRIEDGLARLKRDILMARSFPPLATRATEKMPDGTSRPEKKEKS